jgi:hypothetical protein
VCATVAAGRERQGYQTTNSDDMGKPHILIIRSDG